VKVSLEAAKTVATNPKDLSKVMEQKKILESLYEWASGAEAMTSIIQEKVYNMQPFEEIYNGSQSLSQDEENWNCFEKMNDAIQVMEHFHKALDNLIADVCHSKAFVRDWPEHCLYFFDAILYLYAAILYARE
jgi:hypothetical protein